MTRRSVKRPRRFARAWSGLTRLEIMSFVSPPLPNGHLLPIISHTHTHISSPPVINEARPKSRDCPFHRVLNRRAPGAHDEVSLDALPSSVALKLDHALYWPPQRPQPLVESFGFPAERKRVRSIHRKLERWGIEIVVPGDRDAV